MRFRHILILAAALCLAFAPQTLAADSADKVDSQCAKEAEAFLATVDTVPTTLAGLEEFPADQRRILFGELDALTKAAVWAEHLEAFLDSRVLNDRQLRVIEHAAEMLSPRFYSTTHDDVLWEAVVQKPIEGLSLSANNVFDQDEMITIFATLGTTDTAERGAQITGAEKGLIRCACNRWYNGCGTEHYCGGGCEYRNSGCGVLWAQPCDGLCQERW